MWVGEEEYEFAWKVHDHIIEGGLRMEVLLQYEGWGGYIGNIAQMYAEGKLNEPEALLHLASAGLCWLDLHPEMLLGFMDANKFREYFNAERGLLVQRKNLLISNGRGVYIGIEGLKEPESWRGRKAIALLPEMSVELVDHLLNSSSEYMSAAKFWRLQLKKDPSLETGLGELLSTDMWSESFICEQLSARITEEWML